MGISRGSVKDVYVQKPRTGCTAQHSIFYLFRNIIVHLIVPGRSGPSKLAQARPGIIWLSNIDFIYSYVSYIEPFIIRTWQSISLTKPVFAEALTTRETNAFSSG